MDKKFLLRKENGDQPISAEAELKDWLQEGQCKPSDFLYDFEAKKWWRAGEFPAAAALFADKPTGAPDRRVIYYLAPGGRAGAPLGPRSTKEIQALARAGEICANTWVFVEGDKEWRQVKSVKILNDMLPPVPTDVPAEPAAPMATLSAPPFALTAAPTSGPATAPPSAPPAPPSISLDAVALPEAEPEREAPSMPSITLDLGAAVPGADVPPPKPPPPAVAPTAPPAISTADAGDSAPALSVSDDDPHVEREEVTMALDTMGLKLHSENFSAPPPPQKPPSTAPARPSIAPLPSVPGAAPAGPPKAPPPAGPASHLNTGAGGKDDAFDGIVAEIPTDPIWLVKQASGEVVSGPFRFLEVTKFLEEGKLTKNDKIARTGSKAFTKISQQYEFNVKYSIENVIEGGQEKQKILIRRRHPRVPYITGVQVVSKHGLMAGQCVNISAGGILMEIAKAEFNLGDIIEVKILPGLINKSISCKSLIIGKIPKAPPGYALKFEDLKPEDKEAIEHYVQETLKREMSKKN